MKYDVIVVLAGGIKDDGSVPDNVVTRIKKAKELYDKHLSDQILMSGRWSIYREKHIPPYTEAEAMCRYAIKIGIPRSVIYKEEESNNTKSNTLYTFEHFIKPNKWKKIIVVTSDFHIRRTKYIFDKTFGPGFQIRYERTKTKLKIVDWIRQRINERISLFFYRS